MTPCGAGPAPAQGINRHALTTHIHPPSTKGEEVSPELTRSTLPRWSERTIATRSSHVRGRCPRPKPPVVELLVRRSHPARPAGAAERWSSFPAASPHRGWERWRAVAVPAGRVRAQSWWVVVRGQTPTLLDACELVVELGGEGCHGIRGLLLRARESDFRFFLPSCGRSPRRVVRRIDAKE